MALTQERLKELLHYDPETGVFAWKVRPSNCVKVGDVAGTKHPKGYWRVRVDNDYYLAHRLAWLYVNGMIPDGLEIDHRDGDKLNNRLANLRLATRSQNQQNFRKPFSTSKSGMLGASWHAHKRKWRAAIKVGNKHEHIGYFDTAEEAHAAYVEAKRKHHQFNTL